jgi:hypothetical protein
MLGRFILDLCRNSTRIWKSPTFLSSIQDLRPKCVVSKFKLTQVLSTQLQAFWFLLLFGFHSLKLLLNLSEISSRHVSKKFVWDEEGKNSVPIGRFDSPQRLLARIML